jgi:hypothetical protein
MTYLEISDIARKAMWMEIEAELKNKLLMYKIWRDNVDNETCRLMTAKESDHRFYSPQGICPFWVDVKIKECKGRNKIGKECGYKISTEDKCSLSSDGPK